MSCSCTSGTPRSFRVQHGWHVQPMKTGGFHGWKAHLKLLLWQGQSLQAWNVRNFMGLVLLSEKMKPKKHHKIHFKKNPSQLQSRSFQQARRVSHVHPVQNISHPDSAVDMAPPRCTLSARLSSPMRRSMTRHSGLEVLPCWRHAWAATRPTCQKRAFLGALCTGRNWQTWRRDDLYLSYKV